ncbi:MAG: NAD-dependent epimerase/dehydratase family protein [Chitinophagales bacterium]|nr:NAD-dependent epimerase/dehydratase family protein [Chitinophagales bacterium]
MRRKILVTGGAGFIGSSIVERLVQNDNNFVVIVDNMLTGKKGRLPQGRRNNWKFIQCDVNNFKDISTVMMSYNFDYVFHYAAVVGVQRTLQNPALVLGDIDGIKNILDLSKNSGVKRIFFSSSSEVYGEPFEHPQNEHTTPLNSRLPYAVVKNLGEVFLRSYKQAYNLDYTIFRFFNTYGPKQSTDFVMSKFVKAALKNQDITIYGDGKQSRTFCFIEDNIDASLNAFYDNLYINDTVNIGNDREIQIIDLAEMIIECTNSRSKIVHVAPLEEGDMQRRKPDIVKMKALLNRDLIPLEEGLSRMLNKYQTPKLIYA